MKNKLCKSIIAVVVAMVILMPYIAGMDYINSHAEEDYKIYAEDGDIRDYVTGEGTYFGAHRSFYKDSKGQVVYCLQSGMLGASSGGTSGYRDNQAKILASEGLVSNIKNVVAKGYPCSFGTYVVGGTNKSPVYKTGLLIGDKIYTCTKEEARAATAFSIHKKMSEYETINPDASVGNNETILSYKNGSQATNDVVEICNILIDDQKEKSGTIQMSWALQDVEGNFSDIQKLSVTQDDKDGNMCIYVHITSKDCYVDNITLQSNDGYVQGAYIDEIQYVSVFEKYICVKIPQSAENYKNDVGISCSASVGEANSAKFMGNLNFQDIIVAPSGKKTIDASLYGQLPNGEGMLYKADYDTKNPIAGVTFGVYKDAECSDLVTSIVTGDDGYAYAENLECGLYYVKETACRKGYILSTEVHELNVYPNSIVSITLYNKRIPIFIEIHKVDYDNKSFTPQGDAILEGAVYGLYAGEDILNVGKEGIAYLKDSLIREIRIDKYGKGQARNLYPGKYYVKEIKSPIGYTLDDTIYNVDCNVYDNSLDVIGKEIVVSDIAIKQAFQLVKFYGQVGEEQKPLEGAGFCAWLISDLEIDENGKYNFDSAKPYPIGANGENEMYTDATGYACSAELPYGKYIISETTVPEGFLPIDDFTVNISADSRTPQILRMFNDEKMSARLKIIKIDDTTGRTILEPGYKFRVYDLNNSVYVEQKVSYPKENTLDVFETNKDGYLILPEKLSAGNYRIEEVGIPKGSDYMINKDGIEINISAETIYKEDGEDAIIEVSYPNTPITGNLIIHKIFEDGSSLSSYENKIENASASDAESDNKVIFGLYSGDTRICTIDIDDTGYGYASELPLGKYYLIEESTLDGYIRKDEQIPFEISSDAADGAIVVVELEVENKLTAVEFCKKDYVTGNIVVGATLILMDADGKVIEQWVSKNTTHIVKGLSVGKEYTLVEEYAPYGYLKADNVKFVVGGGYSNQDRSTNNDGMTQEVTIYDKCPIGKITVNKYGDIISNVASEDNLANEIETVVPEFEEAPLAGVEFALYAAEDIICADGSGKVIYAAGSRITTVVTDRNGIAVFDNLMLGNYFLVETKSDSEHVVKPYSIPVQLQYVDQYTEVIEAKNRVQNERIKSRIKINKTDSQLSIPLANAVFGIYSKEDIYDINEKLIFAKDSLIDRKISDETGIVIFQNSLVPGEYYVKELEAPKGYVLTENIYNITVKSSVDTELEMNIPNAPVGVVMGESKMYEIETSQQVRTGDDFNPAVAVMLIISVIGMIVISFYLYLKSR